MAEYDIDRLQIEIEASASEAAKELDELTRALEGLKSALSGAGLSGAVDDMDDLGDETEDVDKALRDAKDSGLKFGDVLKANILSDAIMSGVRALGNALADMGRGLLDFAKDGVSLASDLEEVQNVVDVTFGTGASQIEDFAKAAATGFGMSELSAKQFTGTMGAMLKSMGLSDDTVMDMSTALTALAGDMASFYNLDPETAFEKLRAGISGETEPLKQLGINMSVANLEAYALAQGIEKAYRDMTQAEQATLRYGYLMQATADAQGDFARTSGSYANQQRILQLNMENLAASIGSKVLPYLTNFSTALNGLLSGQTDVQTFVGSLSGMVIQAADGIIAGLPVLTEAGGQIFSALFSGLETLGPTAMEVAFQILDVLTNSILSGLPMLLETGASLLVSLVNGISERLPDLIPAAMSVTMQLVETLTNPETLTNLVDAGLRLIVSLAEGLVKAIPELIGQIPFIIKNLVSSLVESAPKILAAGVQLIVTLGLGLIQAIPELVTNIPKVIAAIVGGLTNGIKKIVEVGKNIVSGVWEGIKSMATWIKDKVSGFFSGIVDSVKGLLGIHSPSRVFAGIGGFMAEGLGSGWADEIGAVQTRIARSVSGLIPDLSVSVPVSGMRPAMASAGSGLVAAPPMRSASSVIENYSTGPDNSAVVSAVYSIGRNIVEAVRTKDGDIYMDGQKVGRQTTSAQNRTNRMYGKTLQNT